MSRAEQAEWVRLNFPVVSAFAAAVRAEFPDVRLTYASEAGLIIGSPAPVAAFSVSGDDLVMQRVDRRGKV